jgi:hypothetical protein
VLAALLTLALTAPAAASDAVLETAGDAALGAQADLVPTAAINAAPGKGGGGGKPGKGTTCPTASDLQQPFLQFGDSASYFLAPGGSFESTAWSGGKIVSGNEPFKVRLGGANDSRSLAIPKGKAATSQPTCIGLGDPTIRFFATRTAGPPTATLGLAVSFDTLAGSMTLPLVPVAAVTNGTWDVTLPIPILANATVLPQPTGVDPINGLPTANVRFIFTPAAGSAWQIDDVFVDPYQRN